MIKTLIFPYFRKLAVLRVWSFSLVYAQRGIVNLSTCPAKDQAGLDTS